MRRTVALLVAGSLLVMPASAGPFGLGKTPPPAGGSPSSGDAPKRGDVAREPLVQAYLASVADVTAAQLLLARAFELKDLVGRLEMESVALQSSSTLDAKGLQKQQALSDEADAAIAAKMDAGAALSKEGKEYVRASLEPYGHGVLKAAKLPMEYKRFIDSARGAGTSVQGALSLAGKGRAALYVSKRVPSFMRSLGLTFRQITAYAKKQDIEVPADATAALDSFGSAEMEMATLEDEAAVPAGGSERAEPEAVVASSPPPGGAATSAPEESDRAGSASETQSTFEPVVQDASLGQDVALPAQRPEPPDAATPGATSVRLPPAPQEAARGGGSKGLFGAKPGAQPARVDDAPQRQDVAADPLVRAYLASVADVTEAQLLLARAFDLKDLVSRLEMERVALQSSSTLDAKGLKKQRVLSEEADEAIAAKMGQGTVLSKEGKAHVRASLRPYGEGVLKAAKLPGEVKRFAESAQSSLGSVEGMLSLGGKGRAAVFVFRRAPKFVMTLGRTFRQITTYAKKQEIEVPADATAALDALGGVETEMAMLGGQEALPMEDDLGVGDEAVGKAEPELVHEDVAVVTPFEVPPEAAVAEASPVASPSASGKVRRREAAPALDGEPVARAMAHGTKPVERVPPTRVAGPAPLPMVRAPLPRLDDRSATALQLREALASSARRLDRAAHRLRRAPMSTSGQRAGRAAHLRRCSDALTEAATTARVGESLRRLIDRNDHLAEVALALSDEAVARVTGRPAPARSVAPDEAAWTAGTAVPAFEAVADAVATVSAELDDRDRRVAGLMTQAGRDVVQMLSAAELGPDVSRAHVMSLRDIIEILAAMHQDAVTAPVPAAEVRLSRNVPQGWMDCGAEHEGLVASRVRFLEPGSAVVTLHNGGSEPRTGFVELEFTDAAGEPTGLAMLEGETGRPLRPGETRDVELQIEPAVARFWDHTRRYSAFIE